MLEILPISPSFPVVKPKKIKRDDDFQEKPQRKKQQQAKQQDAEPIQHIDEIV